MPETAPNSGGDIGDLSFEQAMSRLDETVDALEAGGLALADATRLFEEGMKLARLCSEMLASAELRITRIQTAYGEQMRMLEEQGQGGPPC
ncbi:MAG: exodeoxyribonuclease VII small subunit [Chloroflexi bacterium]|nr:exodeoxyribonuclease VII small subunit [Chloroflexota bacterium]